MPASLHQRAERRSQVQWPSSHLVIIGLLVYIAAFQTVVTTSFHRQSDSQLMGDNVTSALFESLQESRAFQAPNFATNTIAKAAKVLPVHAMRLPTNTNAMVAKVLPFHNMPWRRQSPVNIEISYPIFVTGLPKTGTTSVFKFFRCGRVSSTHAWGTKPGAEKPTLLGECIHENILHGYPPFEGCGAYDLFSDTGFIKYDHDMGLQCFFPSVDGLDAIYSAYPNATFVHPVRKASDWYQSLKAWAEGSLFIRLRLCNGTNFPTGQSTKEDYYRFYDWHNEMIRNFVKERPSLTYLELDLAAKETGAILEERTGISRECWRKCLPDKRRCESND